MTVDGVLGKADMLFLRGLEYQEILQALTGEIEEALSGGRKCGRMLNRVGNEKQERNVSHSEFGYYDSRVDRESNKSRLSEWEEYSDRHNRFYQEYSEISVSAQKIQKNSFQIVPPLEIASKIDEIRALGIVQPCQPHIKELEYRRRLDRFLAEKEISSIRQQQIQEKEKNIKNIESEKREYAQLLEERSQYIKAANISANARSSMIKHAYSQALSDQIQHKLHQKTLISQLNNEGRRIVHESSPNSYNNSISSERSSPIEPKAHSPLKFLMQYGNYVIHPSKKH